jgi:hypothetical protein
MHPINRRSVVLFLPLGMAILWKPRLAWSQQASPAAVAASVRKASKDAEASLLRQLKLDEQLPPEQRTSQRYVSCVARALDGYAAALQTIAPTLPVHVQALPTIVAQTAQAVHSSRTPAAASAAMTAAIGEVRKTLELIKADDPPLARAEISEVRSVDETLSFLNDKLVKATGI